MKYHRLLKAFFALFFTGQIFACSPDDGSAPDSDAGVDTDTGMDGDQSDTDNADSGNADSGDEGVCAAGEWRDFSSMTCEVCPSPELKCDSIAIDETAVDTSTGTVSVTLKAGKAEVLSASASGSEETVENGGTRSSPTSASGSIAGNSLTFEFTDTSSADRVTVSRLDLLVACNQDGVELPFTISWEPGGDIVNGPACLPDIGR